jgi:hypothetical protein
MADAYEAIRQSKNAWSAAWVALHLGDALLAVELLANQSPASLLARADEERRDRVERLVAWLAVDEFTAPRLRALAELGREHAEGPALKQLERDPVDGSVSAALELVGHWADAGHVEAVLRVAQRVRGTVPPSPWVRTFAAELVLRLVRRDALSSTVRRQLLDALELPGSSGGHAGLLIAFLEVDRGLASLRRALNADTKVVRVEAAAALGVIGTKEALFELRTSESVEAQTVLSAMKSDEPTDDSDSWAVDAYKEFVHRFTGLRERWLAH